MKKKNIAHINFDPVFAFGKHGLTYSVHVTKPAPHLTVDMTTCEVLNEN